MLLQQPQQYPLEIYKQKHLNHIINMNGRDHSNTVDSNNTKSGLTLLRLKTWLQEPIER